MVEFLPVLWSAFLDNDWEGLQTLSQATRVKLGEIFDADFLLDETFKVFQCFVLILACPSFDCSELEPKVPGVVFLWKCRSVFLQFSLQ
jgi:hypothetical protein